MLSYGAAPTPCYEGLGGLRLALDGDFDLIILDVMLPGMDGFTVARSLRTQRITTPILMLTAKSDTEDRIRGLDCGADYYLPKPFSMGELIACVRALTRRSGELAFDTMCFGDLSLNLSSCEMVCRERRVRLGRKELLFMRILIGANGALVTKEDILSRVWGDGSEAENNNAEVYISVLRKKMAFLHTRVHILTQRKSGYYLEYDECFKS